MSSHHLSSGGFQSNEKKELEQLQVPVPLSKVFEIPDIAPEEMKARIESLLALGLDIADHSNKTPALQATIQEFCKLPESLEELCEMPSMDPKEVQASMTSISSRIDEMVDSLSPNAAYAAAMKEMAQAIRESAKSYKQDSKPLDKQSPEAE